jgi:hypothetical protein
MCGWQSWLRTRISILIALRAAALYFMPRPIIKSSLWPVAAALKGGLSRAAACGLLAAVPAAVAAAAGTALVRVTGRWWWWATRDMNGTSLAAITSSLQRAWNT